MFQNELGSGCGCGIQKEGEKTFMENVKTFIQSMGNMFHKVGFWVLVLVLVGAFLGGTAMTWYQKSQMDNAIMLGGFVYDNKVFDIKERIR